MQKNTTWHSREYDIWTDDSPAAKAVREQMPWLLTDDELARQPQNPPQEPPAPYHLPVEETDARKATAGIISLLTDAASRQHFSRQQSESIRRQLAPETAQQLPDTSVQAASITAMPRTGQAKTPDVTDMLNTDFSVKVPQAQIQNAAAATARPDTTPAAPAWKPHVSLTGDVAASVASGKTGDATAYSSGNLQTASLKLETGVRETGKAFQDNAPAITESVMSGMTEDGGTATAALKDAQAGRFRIPPAMRIANALTHRQAEDAKTLLKNNLSLNADMRDSLYGKKLDNPEVAKYWKQGMEHKIRESRNAIRRLALTADGYMQGSFDDRYISYEKDLLESYRQEQALIDSNRLVSVSELYAARNSDEFAEKLQKFGYQTVLGGKLFDIAALFSGNHLPLAVSKLYQAYDAIARLYTNALLKNGRDISKATVLGGMVGKTVAEWNENIRQVAQGMGPVTGTMLLVINDTMTTEAKQWVIDYVGRRDTENITKNR